MDKWILDSLKMLGTLIVFWSLCSVGTGGLMILFDNLSDMSIQTYYISGTVFGILFFAIWLVYSYSTYKDLKNAKI